MKKFTIVFCLFLISITGYSQNSTNDSKKDDVKITINVSKINKTLGGIVKFVKDEATQFKNEAEAGFTDEDKAKMNEAKDNVKYELKYIHDAIHQGWKQGWKKEDYTPPYKHK